ncbi:4'-phosphopantetheinyl transferase family protein [Aspergillus saccharolyticus JOP 1030-1]|uniref:holo-[acyl-carrier-protein] synthase n=1 Tax=Aspergillus saccharolyticus JOP 1030-1 TaxID=1450539 RepID=A0A318ZPL3_9EURO|nr:hypothetical protein BP01DRAFT_356077 [Aspergillus saccharolyticus JOP 1030-1]PYH45860.1 hypothetical protein BP01DRAFT_356077 [Aspergillus saccharolyticus JOP 1030-1]
MTIAISPSNDAGNPTPTNLTRWYIDTRPLTATNDPANLPLLATLQPEDQTAILRYYHLKDKHMSLASNLLKYLFIHRSCRIPWDKITLSRTAAPHRRPCFIPSPALLAEYGSSNNKKKILPSVEFNVSHQASLVALAGTTLPLSNPNPNPNPNPKATATATTDNNNNNNNNPRETIPQVGIDITCTNERQPSARNAAQDDDPVRTFNDYVDIFAEVFSPDEIAAIKNLHLRHTSSVVNEAAGGGGAAAAAASREIEYRYRGFYAYWALKEAYIKMTGEALLAPWLRQLEFAEVVPPEPLLQDQGPGQARVGEPFTGVRTTLNKKPVEDVRLEIVAFETNYLIATAARGAGIGARSDTGAQDTWEPLREIDIERDIQPCAEGRCRCLD